MNAPFKSTPTRHPQAGKEWKVQTQQQGGSRRSVRALVRGLDIQAKGIEGGVVHLTVGREQQHKGLWRRFRQHLAHALFRAGDACNPRHDDRALRVVDAVVGRATVDDGLPHGRDPHALKGGAVHAADRDADDQVLVVYEGVKGHHDRLGSIGKVVNGRWQKGADDAHASSPAGLNDRPALILPDDGAPVPQGVPA